MNVFFTWYENGSSQPYITSVPSEKVSLLKISSLDNSTALSGGGGGKEQTKTINKITFYEFHLK